MAKKTKKTEQSWDKIGEMIGKKIEKEMKDKNCCSSWHENMFKNNGSDCGCFGRILFIVGLYVILNTLGLLAGIPMWAIVMTGIGFALMRF